MRSRAATAAAAAAGGSREKLCSAHSGVEQSERTALVQALPASVVVAVVVVAAAAAAAKRLLASSAAAAAVSSEFFRKFACLQKVCPRGTCLSPSPPDLASSASKPKCKAERFLDQTLHIKQA